tara:strand:- start:10626 stop:10787 length:162 start_codon:yes stop_codon:yes gene_type:complete
MVCKEKLVISGLLANNHSVAVNSARSFICSTAATPAPIAARAPTAPAITAPLS